MEPQPAAPNKSNLRPEHQSALDWLETAMRESQAGHFRVAIIAAYTAVSQACDAYRKVRWFNFNTAIETLYEEGKIKGEDLGELRELGVARREAAHAPYSGPSRSRVEELISAASSCLKTLGLDVESMMTARLQGVFYSVKWPKSEQVRLATFRTDHLGFTTLCPVDWELSEEKDRVSFALRPPGLTEMIKQTPFEAYDRLQAAPKIMTFRRTPKALLPRDVFESDSKLFGSSVGETHEQLDGTVSIGSRTARVFYIYELESRWTGDVFLYELDSGAHIALGFYLWLAFGLYWRPMCADILKNFQLAQRHERPLDLIAQVCRQEIEPLLKDSQLEQGDECGPYELLIGDSIGSDERHLKADFAVKRPGGYKNKIIGIVEWPSTITRDKVERWRSLDGFAEEVRVYVPLPFSEEVREHRAAIGSRTRVFRINYDERNRLQVSKLEL